MSELLRWGILGTGNIARQFAASLKTSQRTVAHAVASRRRGSAEAFARRHGAGALRRDPAVEACDGALPNAMHHQWTVAALKAGKHVLCEKPIAANAAEA